MLPPARNPLRKLLFETRNWRMYSLGLIFALFTQSPRVVAFAFKQQGDDDAGYKETPHFHHNHRLTRRDAVLMRSGKKTSTVV